MAKQQSSPAVVLVRGILASLGIYVAGVVLLALLAVRGTVGEETVFGMVAVLCGAAVMVGGLLCGRKLPWSTMVNVLVCTAGFAAVMVLVCLAIGEGLGQRGGVLLGCALLGGCGAGLLCGRRGRRSGARRVKRR